MNNQTNVIVLEQCSSLLNRFVLDIITNIYIVPDREEFRHGDDVYIQSEEIMYTLGSASNKIKWTTELISQIPAFSGIDFAEFCNEVSKKRELLDGLDESIPRLARVRAKAFQLLVDKELTGWAKHISSDSEVNSIMREDILKLLSDSSMKDVMSVLGAFEHCSLSRNDVQFLGDKLDNAMGVQETKDTLSIISAKYSDSFDKYAQLAA
ncbi:hypothetical protein LMH73_022455 [Vibrio splendidus]|nr:hypothetical protein [Vibrio splendidus]MCC4878469.1 hypothetical protein [Vibrio splendidus]